MKEMYFWGLIIILLSTVAVPEIFASETRIFVFAGQSNMANLGKREDLPDDLKEAPRNVVFWGKKDSAYGLELSFAHEISRAFPHDRIVIVKYAYGSTSMNGWSKDWEREKGDREQDRLVSHYAVLMKLVEEVMKAEKGGKVEAFLWMQGEADRSRSVDEFVELFKKRVAEFREGLKSNDLPFIYGRLHDKLPGGKNPREAQAKAEKLLANAVMVDLDGCETGKDNTHFTGKGVLEVGRRFAKAYLERFHNESKGNTKK